MDVLDWTETELPEGWSFWEVPAKYFNGGQTIFPVYDETQKLTPLIQMRLEAPNKEIIVIQCDPAQGYEHFQTLIREAIETWKRASTAS